VIDPERFKLIARKHGGYASWAVWAKPTAGPKSNIDDLSVFDIVSNPGTLQLLKNDVIMVGLNISRSLREQFRNFHDPNPRANDFKIRYAFTNTEYYGAYMTDVIKNVVMVSSAELLRHLRAVPSLVQANIRTFRDELRDLGSRKPTILAFGSAAYELIADNLPGDEYSRLIRLTHYSHRISKEKYKKTVLAQIKYHNRKDCAG
jgi:hypothetical protein